jgi:protein farnesyltransferase subunit beta
VFISYIGQPELEELRKTAYVEARSWAEEENESVFVNGTGDRLVSMFAGVITPTGTDCAYTQNATHPVLNMTMTHVKAILNHFYKQA